MIAPADEASPTRLLDHCPCCGGAAPCGNRSHAAHRSSTTAHDAPTFGPYRPANIGCRALRPEPHASPRQHRPHASPERRQQRRSSGHDDRSASCRARTHSRSAPPRHRGTLSDRRLGPGGPATIPIARPRPPGLLNPASMRSRSHLPSTFVSRDLTEPSRFRPRAIGDSPLRGCSMRRSDGASHGTSGERIDFNQRSIGLSISIMC
jgi:hypothetical protein